MAPKSTKRSRSGSHARVSVLIGPGQRAVLQKVWKALPLGFLTLAYALYTVDEIVLLGLDGAWLSRLFMLEFLAIHSFVFMMFLLVWRPSSDKVRGLRAFLVMSLATFYVLGAYSMAEWAGVIVLMPLIIGTYFGQLAKGIQKSVLPELIVRGIINIIAFLGCATIFDLSESVENWKFAQETVWAGFTYFLLLLIVEMSEVPERLASKVNIGREKSTLEEQKDPLLVPTTLWGIWVATVPLLASFGLAFASYLVVPIIAGIGGRTIDHAVDTQTSNVFIRYWFFFVFVWGFGAVRTWQLRMAFSGTSSRHFWFVAAGMWVFLALAGGVDFLAADHVHYSSFWALREVGWLMMLDILLLIPLIPAVWWAVHVSPRPDTSSDSRRIYEKGDGDS